MMHRATTGTRTTSRRFGPTWPTEAISHASRVRERQRATLALAAVLFAVYYASFTYEGLYTLPSLVAGLAMALGLVGAAVLATDSDPGVRRRTALGVGSVLAGGAVVSAVYSHGSACLGFHTLWAIPLIYGLFFQDQPVGTAFAWAVSFVGGIWILNQDGEPNARVGQWMVLSASAGVFTVLIQDRMERELTLLMAMNDDAMARLTVAERLASQGILAAGVAHEVNNPLTFVLANVDYALRQAAAVRAGTANQDAIEEIIAALEDARVGCDRVAGVVTSLSALSLSGPETRKPVDLNGFVQRVVGLSRAGLEKTGTLRFEPGDAPSVSGDDRRLAHVLLNLLANAAHAVADRPDGPRTVVVRTFRREGSAVIEVSDAGPGMTAAELTRIFEPFYTTKASDKGTGLGLALSARIVRDHAGVIEVESTKGEGTTFRVVLPAAQGAATRPGIRGRRRARRWPPGRSGSHRGRSSSGPGRRRRHTASSR